MLPEDPLEAEPESLRRPAGTPVGRVALPFEAPVAKRVEHVPGQQEDRLGGAGRPVEPRSEPDVPDLADAVRGVDPHQPRHSARRPIPEIDARERQRIVCRRRVVQIGTKGYEVRKRAGRHVVPEAAIGARAVGRVEQGSGVGVGIERFEPDEPARQGDPAGRLDRLPPKWLGTRLRPAGSGIALCSRGVPHGSSTL